MAQAQDLFTVQTEGMMRLNNNPFGTPISLRTSTESGSKLGLLAVRGGGAVGSQTR